MTEYYRDLMKKLNIYPVKIISRNDKKNYLMVLGTMNNEDVLVKFVPKNDTNKVSGLQKEMLVDNIIEKHNRKSTSPSVEKASVLSVQSNEECVWIIRKYYQGESLSNFKPNRFIMGYDILQSKYILGRKSIVKQIVDNLNALQKIEKDFRELKTKKEFFKSRYKTDITQYHIENIENSFNIDLSSQINFYEKNKINYFNEKIIKACNGDLVPANIILQENKKIIFSDFEWFCFDNYMMDPSFLWLFLWRYPKWQNDLIDLIIKNDKDRCHFRASIIRQIIGFINYAFDPKKNNQKTKNAIEKFRNHIWTKYLIAAGESYDKLINIRN